MKLKAYAKVNLILKVINKEENGYHNLQMINTLINIYDEIEIKPNNLTKDTLSFKNTHLTSKDDLVLKVLLEFKKMYGIKECFDIAITKYIPIGAGLGGGSSDVACIIDYLCETYNIDKDQKLYSMLSNMGSDILYFLYKGTRYVEGTGNQVLDENIKIEDEFVIVYPNICLSTKDVFVNNNKYSKKTDKDILINIVKNKQYNLYINDLEESAFNVNANLLKIKEELSKVGTVVMSGSGSTMMVFGKNIDDIYRKCLNIYPSFYIKKVKSSVL